MKIFLKFLYFTCCPHPFSLQTLLFIKRPCFIIFILSLCSNNANFGKHIWIHTSKINKNILILKFHSGMKCLHIFFSFSHPGVKFHLCLFDRDEFILGWNFISLKSCKQKETFHNRQGWFRQGTNVIPGWNFACKHLLRRSSPIILRKSVLRCCKAKFTFFSTWVFFHKYLLFTG